MKFFKMVLIEISKETWGTDRMRRDLEIVYVLVPVLANIVYGCGRRGRHGAYYKIKIRMEDSRQFPVTSFQ